MYRHLVIYPKSAAPSVVDDLVERTAAVFRRAPGFRSMTTSVGALMGPSARAGEHGRVVESDFDSLDAALAVVESEDFQEVRAAAESLGPTILVFEVDDT